MQNSDVTVVSAKRGLFSLNLKELWKYRDLVILFVKRDLKNVYKQTVLGPLWIVINPFLSTFVFTVIFGIIANISTDGIPQFLFYMSGNILWSYFSNCFNRASSTFLSNARIFGKVYFPRLVMPLSGIIYNSITFLVQFVMFAILVAVYAFTGANVHPNLLVLALPVILIHIAFLGTGTGLIISSLTTKYRDLNVLVSFGLTLWMYLTPVVYPVSQIPESFRWIMLLNPVAPVVETFRYAFLGSGSFDWIYLLISAAVTAVILILGMIVFNQVEKNFIDTV
ncbi:ABC transporter permease [Ruminococcus sp.]|uniref:ABC transporter permease n=1 Tax=Ruminococcus sp. TaxID=41978 RepID=UPI002612A3FF|nr:ABC transporter permease [Ruminococcus sp.]MDD6988936.1 ABC transporter permease [Ruminococcus sp.]MDY6201296.1 ABC transporter permease [Ruminococcus sp.]